MPLFNVSFILCASLPANFIASFIHHKSKLKIICPCHGCTFATNFIAMDIPKNDKEIRTPADWLQRIEGYVRQYCELVQIESELSVLRIPSTEETATHMAVRLAAEREIHGRKDYLAEVITHAVARHFDDEGMLSKYPELHTSRSEK